MVFLATRHGLPSSLLPGCLITSSRAHIISSASSERPAILESASATEVSERSSRGGYHCVIISEPVADRLLTLRLWLHLHGRSDDKS